MFICVLTNYESLLQRSPKHNLIQIERGLIHLLVVSARLVVQPRPWQCLIISSTISSLREKGLAENSITRGVCSAGVRGHNFIINMQGSPTEFDVPFLSSSVSAPSAIEAIRTWPQHNFSFHSDVSVLSSASAEDPKAWLCGSCTYGNSDMYYTTCALCGCTRCIATASCANNVSISSGASVSSDLTSGRHTIFTIDSTISLPNRLVSARSITLTSRTSETNVSPNFTNLILRRPGTASSSSGPLQRPRCEDMEEDGCNQPPIITRNDRDDENSEITCRVGSLRSDSINNSSSHTRSLSFGQGESESESVDNSLHSQRSRRRIVPHDDPTEMQPRQGRRHRSHQHGQDENIYIRFEASSVKPLQGTDYNGCVAPLEGQGAISANIGSKKKKSLKDYIRGLRRSDRRCRPSNTTSTTAASNRTSSSTHRKLSGGRM
jgi:hypothetical protein